MIRDHYHYVTYAGKSLNDFGVHISGEGTFSTPEVKYETVEVPGRNGDLLIDTGVLKNRTLKYPAFILADNEEEFRHMFTHFVNFIISKKGVVRIEDTYHPEVYMMGSYKSALDPEVILLQAANFDLEFDVKPQRFLKSGEYPVEYFGEGILFNETDWDANPLIHVFGNGSVTIGDYNIAIADCPHEDFFFDCETMNAFTSNGDNCNSYVTLTVPDDKNNIVLVPGDNSISFTGITRLEIYPRWWIV